ncbi:hypothetical protein SEVIR_2G051601v4 [Setaria viridis]
MAKLDALCPSLSRPPQHIPARSFPVRVHHHGELEPWVRPRQPAWGRRTSGRPEMRAEALPIPTTRRCACEKVARMPNGADAALPCWCPVIDSTEGTAQLDSVRFTVDQAVTRMASNRSEWNWRNAARIKDR